jgi:hypothetical protein
MPALHTKYLIFGPKGMGRSEIPEKELGVPLTLPFADLIVLG